MVSECREHPTFQEIPEALYFEIECQKFLIKSAVLFSAGLNCLLKKASGSHAPCICCWRTAPTASSEAFVVNAVGASLQGCVSLLLLPVPPWPPGCYQHVVRPDKGLGTSDFAR